VCATVGKKDPAVKPKKPKKPEHTPVTAAFVRPTPTKPDTPKVTQVAPAGIEVGTEVAAKQGNKWFTGIVHKTRVRRNGVEYQINFDDGDKDSDLHLWRTEGKKADNIKRV
jgi:hypothetical protein